jgi:hypothetical protein
MYGSHLSQGHPRRPPIAAVPTTPGDPVALSTEELDRRFTVVCDRYRVNFTGHPRATRDLPLLDILIAENQALLAEAAADTDGQLQQQLTLMLGEREAIAAAQSTDHTIARVAAWHDLLQAFYKHRFAGQSRATRDLGLLREIVDHYSTLLATVDAVGEEVPIRPSLVRAKATYERECNEIEWARNAGSESERAQRYALLANDQLALYRRHFAGQSRNTRSVPLLRRMVRSITELRAQMRRLPKTGPHADANAGNIRLLRDKLKSYEQEIGLVEQAKRDQGALGVADALGGAANKLFQEYNRDFAGQSRRTRSLDQLYQIIDALTHIAREMEAGLAVPDSTENHRNNLRIVMDHIRIYTREVDAIVEAQRDGSP